MTPVRLAARPLLASMFVVGGPRQPAQRGQEGRHRRGRSPTRLVPLLQKVVPQLPDDPTTLVRINGAVQLVRGTRPGHRPRAADLGRPAGGDAAAHDIRGRHRFWEEKDPVEGRRPAHPVLQERLDAGRPDAGRRGHRGQAGRRVARPPCRGRRTPRGQAAGQGRPSRGQARPRAADLSAGRPAVPLAWGPCRHRSAPGSAGGPSSSAHWVGWRRARRGRLGTAVTEPSADDQRQRSGHPLRDGDVHAGDRTDEGRLAASWASRYEARSCSRRARTYDQVRLLENPRYDAQLPLAVLSVRVGPGRRDRALVRAGPRHPGGGPVGWPQLPGLVGRRQLPRRW